MPTPPKTPGVYIEELNAFPNSVVQVPTAIPAFIGYTPQAFYEGKSYLMQPVCINSFSEFLTIFAYPSDPETHELPVQYSPTYYLTKQDTQPSKGAFYTFNGDIYTIEPDPGTIYYLYNSVKLFFQNGGSKAYIVSTGVYGAAKEAPIQPGESIVNPNVLLADLQAGLEALKKVQEVTMYIFPEATLLDVEENSTLMEVMLLQCGAMQTAMSIFDVIGGRAPDSLSWIEDIQTFRNNTGNNFLKYGVAYYPFLKTTIVPINEVNYTNINAGAISTLESVLNPPNSPNPSAAAILQNIKAGNSLSIHQNNTALMVASSIYKQILDIIQEQINTLPPSGALAGIYTMVDNSRGVWKAPANVSIAAVSGVTKSIDHRDQEGLNIDAISGKSINVIRFFSGQGILVWGARTLDGNSLDWRYLNVVRTVTMIEQSIQQALKAFVFEPNDANTWTTIKSMLENFLTNLWRQGALAGASDSDAYSVAIGLGPTMTPQDILDGWMRVIVKIAVVRPAEFIVLTFEEQMAQA